MAAAVKGEKVLDYPDEAIDFDDQAGFLTHLAYHRGVGQFADFNVAAGQEPEVVLLDAGQEHVTALNRDAGSAEIKLPVVALESDHSSFSLIFIAVPIVRLHVAE